MYSNIRRDQLLKLIKKITSKLNERHKYTDLCLKLKKKITIEMNVVDSIEYENNIFHWFYTYFVTWFRVVVLFDYAIDMHEIVTSHEKKKWYTYSVKISLSLAIAAAVVFLFFFFHFYSTNSSKPIQLKSASGNNTMKKVYA